MLVGNVMFFIQYFVGATRTLDTPDRGSVGSPAGSVQDVKEHSSSYQSSDSEFY